MRVSVIIPCYNSEKYLSACLDSVLAQTEKDIEVIVVDDGSRDGTLDIAQIYARKDARVKVLHQQNAGVSAARNLGLKKARGEWVSFVDSDDLLTLDALEVMLEAADEQTDMVVCAHETFDERGGREVFWPQTRWPYKTGEKKRYAAALRLIEGDSILNIMCNKLHRKSLLDREGLCLTAGIAIAEDALFNLEAVLCGAGITYVHKITYRYRIHEASATQKRSAGEFEVHRPWLAAMRCMLERRGMMERYYAAYVNSVVLRLYKDGGIPGVVREFREKAMPLLGREGLDAARMTMKDRGLLRLCETGAYALVYPPIAVAQMVKRKLSSAAFLLRKKKERPE